MPERRYIKDAQDRVILDNRSPGDVARTCFICRLTFSCTEEGLANHAIREHNMTKKAYLCAGKSTGCKREFVSPAARNRHQQTCKYIVEWQQRI